MSARLISGLMATALAATVSLTQAKTMNQLFEQAQHKAAVVQRSNANESKCIAAASALAAGQDTPTIERAAARHC